MRIFLAIFIALIWPSISFTDEIVWGQPPLPYSYTDYIPKKFGFNADVDAAEESIWDVNDLPTSDAGPTRCFENIGITPANLYVSSDNTADATLEISIEVLDATWASSVITMDLGAVSGTGTAFTQIGAVTLLRVNRAFATDDDFTGNIYIHKDAVDGGTDVSQMHLTQI